MEWSTRNVATTRARACFGSRGVSKSSRPSNRSSERHHTPLPARVMLPRVAGQSLHNIRLQRVSLMSCQRILSQHSVCRIMQVSRVESNPAWGNAPAQARLLHVANEKQVMLTPQNQVAVGDCRRGHNWFADFIFRDNLPL